MKMKDKNTVDMLNSAFRTNMIQIIGMIEKHGAKKAA